MVDRRGFLRSIGALGALSVVGMVSNLPSIPFVDGKKDDCVLLSDNTFDLGTSTKRYHDLSIGRPTIHLKEGVVLSDAVFKTPVDIRAEKGSMICGNVFSGGGSTITVVDEKDEELVRVNH